MDQLQQCNVSTAVNRLNPDLAVSLRQVEHADAILVLGADPLQQAPMLALAMRQAYRAGAKVAVIDPRPISLPFEFLHWPLAPKDMDSALGTLLRSALPVTADGVLENQTHPEAGADFGNASEIQQTLAALLQNSLRPVIVCGTEIVGLSAITAAADLALQLQTGNKRAGLFYVLPGPNAFGAAIASVGGESFYELLGDIENGKIKALLLVETDFLSHFPDLERIKNALEKLELLVVLDYLPDRSLEYFMRAPTQMRPPGPASAPMHIILPTLTHFETHASFINQEGRLQQADPVHRYGMPLSQLTGGSHPPRAYRQDIPGAGAKAAWQILSELETAILPSHPLVSSFRDLWSRIEKMSRMDVNSSTKIDKMQILKKPDANRQHPTQKGIRT